jgi:Uma2 family endonuclease
MAAALLRYAEDRESARVLQHCDIAFDYGAIVRPDIVLVRKNRIGIIGKRKLHGPPDLAVEIACECSAPEVLRTKKKIYSELKVQEFWIVHPESETVEVLAWTEIGYAVTGRYGRSDRIRSPLVDGRRIPLCKIFRMDE